MLKGGWTLLLPRNKHVHLSNNQGEDEQLIFDVIQTGKPEEDNKEKGDNTLAVCYDKNLVSYQHVRPEMER